MPTKKKKTSFKSPNLTQILIIALALLITSLFIYSKFYKQPSEPPKAATIQIPQSKLNGIYKGKLPCADCPGIEETLILAGSDKNGTYILDDVYLEKSTAPYKTQGDWERLENNILKLNPEDKSTPGFFKILDNNTLQMLDSNMKGIDSPFNQTLIKQN